MTLRPVGVSKGTLRLFLFLKETEIKKRLHRCDGASEREKIRGIFSPGFFCQKSLTQKANTSQELMGHVVHRAALHVYLIGQLSHLLRGDLTGELLQDVLQFGVLL